MKAEPDGHTLLASETGFGTSQPHLYAKGKLPTTRKPIRSARRLCQHSDGAAGTSHGGEVAA